MPLATVVTSPSNTATQLSDGNSLGVTMGLPGLTANGVPDQVGFFGMAAPQQSGNAQVPLVRGQAAGSILSFSFLASPSSVQAGGTAEVTLTPMPGSNPMPIASTDILVVNKPTSQVGLGVGNVRGVNVGNLALTLNNMTGTTINPTVSQQYQVIALRGAGQVVATLSPAAVPGPAIVEQQFSVTGVRVGQLAMVNKATAQAGLDIVGCRVVSNNVLGISFMNTTAASITPTASESYTIDTLAGLDAINNEVSALMTLSPTSVAAFVTTTEYAAPVAGLVLGDTVKGVSKPSAQNGLAIVNTRVSVPGAVGLQFMNTLGTTTTPTAGEVYEINLLKANPAAPLVVYQQALTPTSVPAQSTIEQTFTVTGLVANSAAWVNKPSAQNNLGIAGVRVSGANTLAITFVNTSAVSITPTPGEVYTIGNFQEPAQTGGVNGPATGNAMHRSVSAAQIATGDLAAAMRNAMTTMGMIAGA